MKYIKIQFIILFLALAAMAGAQTFTTVILEEKTGTLKNNTRYIVNRNITIDASGKYGEAALAVEDGATVILQINSGCTLKLKGCDYQGSTYPATPGLRLPSNSKLIICGKGKLYAQGGKGGGAQSGEPGGNASTDENPKHTEHYDSGYGGAGGRGASGSAPGIGTDGGIGGAGGKQTGHCHQDEKHAGSPNGINGNDGMDGEETKPMGTLIVLDQVIIESHAGEGEPFTKTNAIAGKCKDTNYKTWKDYRCGAGGGGGQGGECIRPENGIGAGAPGSGGGGSGGSGGLDQHYYKVDLINKPGQGGLGGKAKGYYHTGGEGMVESTANPTLGGQPGLGGDCGLAGNDGDIYATFTMKFIDTNVRKVNDVNINLLPEELSHTIVGCKSTDGKEIKFYSGMKLPGKVHEPESKPSPKCVFKGYVDQYGTMLYGADCTLNPDLPKTSRYLQVDETVFLLMDEDLKLTPTFTGQIHITVNHYIPTNDSPYDDPIYNKEEFITSEKTFTLNAQNIPHTYVVRARQNADGTTNDILSHEECYTVISSAVRNFTLSGEDNLKADFYYGRKPYKLNYDYGELGEEAFQERLVNKESYTKAEDVGYGSIIERPIIRQKGGWALKEWSPKDVTYMPAEDLTLTAVMEKVTFDVHIDSIVAGNTTANMMLDKYKGINYQDVVTGTCNIGREAHIKSLKVVRRETGEPVDVTFDTDGTFHFIMPDDNVNIGIAFERIRYDVTAAASNVKGTTIAVTDGNGLFYTENKTYFDIPDAMYGGKLKDFPLYNDSKLYVCVGIENQSYMEHAQATLLFNDGNSMDFENAKQVLIDLDDRVLPFYDFSVTNAQSLSIEVLWKLQTPKTISFQQHGGKVNVVDVMTNGESTYEEKYKGATACMGDLVAMELQTEDKTFNAANICVEYVTAEGLRFYVPVRDYKNKQDGKMYYVFYMPSHNVKVTLNTGEKETITVQEPFNEKNFFVAPQAVKGSVVPFFITDPENIYTPKVTSNDGSEPDIFNYGKTLYRYGSNVDVLTSGAFNMPDAAITISAQESSNAKEMPYISEELRQATGIRNAWNADAAGAKMYNIMGARVGNNYKGIVIFNGRKYINK